jgi:hypothetical protein
MVLCSFAQKAEKREQRRFVVPWLDICIPGLSEQSEPPLKSFRTALLLRGRIFERRAFQTLLLSAHFARGYYFMPESVLRRCFQAISEQMHLRKEV